MANRTRPLILRVPVNEQERELIGQKMKLIPTTNFAAYARKMLIDGYIIQIDHSDIKAMTAEIQKIGVNVNQIARRANATGSVYQEDIEEIKGVLNEIWRLQRLSLLKAL
ncbi:MobC family plasmid mobilization relaxosome protein [Clostridioides difficile]|uniref:plasmid mobilization protein n=1 Tax=Clostridioides difficile TaxID=1496 RepID=UPI00093A26D9|nr:plasmid mobilization relaxosome protein MobC [Clostridioides difficile]EGT5471835.1 plasmid mobilization relaxosome protein MobC [Clostridioides difficile]ELX4588773.1 plasmid mobilization relaxosome protein MobC [Clostridioides difficile]MBG0254767.1 plasmid mobilization relaxosome protein MobC [Clostridioides difficile]MBH7535896.1 plasmid mobilization relaxosome protein MobC [Clostridioides difficile]MBH7846401.1 plasmid mobilization relaxosome protein MobC [Clostridioides difficile]